MRLSPHPTSLTLFPCGNLQGIHAPPLLLPLQTPKGGWVDLLLDQICTRAPLPNITSDELSTAKSKQPYLVLELLTCCQYLRFSWHFFFERVSSPSISATIFPSKSTLLVTSLCTCSVPQLCQTGTPWTAAHQAPLPMGFSRQECWSELPFPPPGDLPNPGTEPLSPQWPLAHTQLNSTLFLYRLFPWWEWALCFVCPSTSSHV